MIRYKLDKWFGEMMSLRTHTSLSHSPYRLSFLQVKLAMRRFCYGPKSGISTDSLSYTQVRQHPTQSTHPDTISLFSTEAQICPKPLGLYVRMQDIVLVRTRDELMCDLRDWIWHTLEICILGVLSRVITAVIESLHHGKNASLAKTCYGCNTYYQVELGESDSKTALIMTRWVSLGPGLTREDPLWKTHVYLYVGDRGRLDRNEPEHFPMAHSPRLCFECKAPQSFEDLRSSNLAYLENQQYKRVMPFAAAGLDLWHISYTEPSKRGRTGLLQSLLGRLVTSYDSETPVEGADETRLH